MKGTILKALYLLTHFTFKTTYEVSTIYHFIVEEAKETRPRSYCWVRIPNQDLCWDLKSRSLTKCELWIHRKDWLPGAFWDHFTGTPISYSCYFYGKRGRKQSEGKQSLKGAFVQIFLVQYLWNRYYVTSFFKMEKFLEAI